MAFGFGFNREKLLASAEKYVQQGKLQNAIGEYQKIIQEDPKDLTVLNTVGDLCARIGQNDQAAVYFRKAGDHYAHDGFTVKAIAIYKKLTRLNPGDVEHVNKLAELYTQQGLITDARAQYMQVADHFLKSGDTAGGARVLQRILELDPENTATKSKLADLYLKLGKKEEARQIYFTAAEALYARGSYQAADEALERVIKMDPHNAGALLLRGMIAADSGDSVSAVGYLEKVSDLDSRPDALRALLRAKIQSDSGDGLEQVASKLLTAHGDAAGIREAAGWFGNHNRFAEALRLYEIHASKLLSTDRNAYLENLYALIPKIRNDREALGIMMRLLENAQDSSHVAELMELQAHASVQKGEFQEARDLYQKLSDLEPDNSLHQQNYKQMQSKLGEDSASRSLSPEEAQQAFMVEALEEAAPAFHENYDPTVEKAIEAALTDAELFVSYNVPTKAIPPLEAVLPMAPRDVTVNQRLATLYARNGRFADAARTCETLSEIYRERGHEKEAAQYLDAAQTYALRAPKGSVTLKGVPTAEASPETPTIEIEVPGEQGAPSVQEFSFDVPDHLTDSADEKGAAPAQPLQEIKIEAAADTGAIAEPPTQPVQEVDVSNEWENMLTVEGEAPPAIDVPAQGHAAEVAPVPVEVQPPASAADSAAEKIQEIQFYIDQEMWDLAKKAILDLTEIAPDAAEITKLISAVSAGQSRAATASAPVPAIPIEPPKPAAASSAKPPAEFALQPEPKAVRRSAPAISQPVAAAVPVESPSATPEFVIAPVQVSGQASKKEKKEKDSPLEEVLEEPKANAAPAKAKAVSPPAAPPSKPAKPVLEESPLDELLTEAPSPAPAKAKKDEKKPAAKAKNEPSTEDILDDFVGDLEKTDLVDFVPRPKAEPAKPAAVTAPAKVSPSAPAAAAAAAPAPEVRTSRNGDMRDAEANSLLTDILSELQEETIDSAAEEGDPDTHYNLGIAFKEMGLLDEAIGELQKVCHAMDRGHAFSQPIQAYTWLAQCLVDKGAPEAAVRWYQRALKLSNLDDASRCAIYYDLAAAYEASGDDKSALASFMEVYGSNIDFRDVASRIKALKS